MLIDQNGQHRFTGDDDPYGINLRSFGDKDTHRFTGQVLDEEQGLYYYGARYYLPEIGRFLSTDPAKEFYNPYSYVGNSPVKLKDPDGKLSGPPDPDYIALPFGSSGNPGAEFAERTLSYLMGFGWRTNVEAELNRTSHIPRPNTGGDVMDIYNRNGKLLSSYNNGLQIDTTLLDLYMLGRGGLTAGKAFGRAVLKTVVTKDVIGEAINIMNRIADAAIEGTSPGRAFGTRAHSAFERMVKTSGVKGLEAEVSFKNGAQVARGTPGSIRIDVGLRGANGQFEIVGDLKTGKAVLTDARIAQIREHMGSNLASDAPVVEIKR